MLESQLRKDEFFGTVQQPELRVTEKVNTMQSTDRPTILLVDDDELIHQTFQLLFADRYHILDAYHFSEALDHLSRSPVDIVFIDLHFKPTNQKGSQFLKILKASHPQLPSIMISGDDSIDRVVECMRIGADDYISKPFEKEAIEKILDRLIPKNRSNVKQAENIDLDSLLIGKSQSLIQAKALIARSRDMRILFVGDTGVGKTPFARYSNLCMDTSGKRPFEQINCASLSRERFQDELFGHKKGAFTSAISDKKGLVEIASGGDLFLDEIGEMPLDVQALFLTFLDSMEYYRLGEDQKRKANVRVLCATNRNLKAMVEEGTFRKDLYSRISQVKIDIAPLRERKEDIPLLLKHFIKQFLGYEKAFDPEVLEHFTKADWSEGNVREFRDAVEYICVISKESDMIRVEHISDRLNWASEKAEIVNSTPATHDSSLPTYAVSVDEIYNVGLDDYLTKVEKDILTQLYFNHDRNVNRLSESIRVSRPTLYRKLKKHDVLQ